MSWLSNPNLFMWIITVLFAASALRQLADWNWPQVAYNVGAVVLNLSVIWMGAK